MPYTINKTNGDALVTVADGVLNTDYSVTFVGKNYGNYGAVFNENFLQLMENFSNSTAPSLPVEGQLWWDNVAKSLRVYYSGSWRPIPISNQITGTTNQITVSAISGSSFNLSLPQNIHTDATPTFRSLTLGTTTGAPLTVSSTGLVANLNVDKLDNFDGSFYLDYSNFTNLPSLGTLSSQNANNVNITGGNISALTSPLPISAGGTGGATAEAARISLGLSNIASASLPLSVVNGGTGSDNISGARNNLGIGSIATQNSASISITGGTVTGLTNFGVLSGTATVPTVAVATDSTQIASTAFVHNILPYGVILMWSGSLATIPTGWALCNGSNGTPDLRNRFIIGAAVDDTSIARTTIEGTNTITGGTKDAIIVSHSHSGTTGNESASHSHVATSTVSDPGHFHRLPIDEIGPTDTQSLRNTPNADEGIAGDVRTEVSTTGVTVSTTIDNNSTTHNHSFTTNSQGLSGTNQNLPPYYALAYIMKVTG